MLTETENTVLEYLANNRSKRARLFKIIQRNTGIDGTILSNTLSNLARRGLVTKGRGHFGKWDITDATPHVPDDYVYSDQWLVDLRASWDESLARIMSKGKPSPLLDADIEIDAPDF